MKHLTYVRSGVEVEKVGWEAGIRTPIGGSRVRSLTVRRPPNRLAEGLRRSAPCCLIVRNEKGVVKIRIPAEAIASERNEAFPERFVYILLGDSRRAGEAPGFPL